MPRYPSLLEINSRPWLRRLSSDPARPVTLTEVDDAVLDGFQRAGFDWIWLLSVWEIGPLSRGTFPGHVVFRPRSADPFRWPFVATTSSEGRVLMIAQGQTGRILYDGIVLPTNESKPTFVGGFYRLMSLEGRFDFGAINFTVNQ